MAIDVDRLRSEIEVDASRAVSGLLAFDTALSAASRDRNSDVDVDFASALADMSRFEMAADVATRDRTMNIDVDRDSISALGSLGRVAASAAGGLQSVASAATQAAGGAGGGGGLGGLSSAASGAGGFMAKMVGSIAGVAQSLAGLALGAVVIGSVLPGAFAAAAAAAGILVAALAPLLGLLAAIPVALGGLGVVAGALVGGLAGVFQGVSAYRDATAGAAGATEDLTAKQDALRSAQQGLASAIHQVTKAQQALKDAQEDMAKAPVEAAEAIEDAHFRRRQAIISEKRAILALQQAQENLTNAQQESARAALNITQQTDEFTGKVYDVAVQTDDAVDAAMAQRDALLAVQQAELDLARAQDENGDSARHLREMERKGIKNSDIMVAARRRLADAEWNLKQAHQAVANAQRAVARAQANMNKSSGTAATAAQKWADAQKNLSDEGIEFVKFIADDFLPALSDIGRQIQSAMLPGLQDGLEGIVAFKDQIGDELATVGGMIGDTFADFVEFWSMPEQRDLLTSMFEGLNDVIKAGLDLILPFSRAVVGLMDAAAPMTARIFGAIGDELDRFADWMASPDGSKSMSKFLDDAAYFGGLWWDSMKGLGGVFKAVARAARPLAEKWLKGMGDSLHDMGDYLNSPEGQKMLTNFFERAVPALKETWEFIKGISEALFGTSKQGEDSAFYKAMKTLNDEFIPALTDFFETMDEQDIASDLISLFSEMTNFLEELGSSGTVDALGTLIDMFAELADLGNSLNLGEMQVELQEGDIKPSLDKDQREENVRIAREKLKGWRDAVLPDSWTAWFDQRVDQLIMPAFEALGVSLETWATDLGENVVGWVFDQWPGAMTSLAVEYERARKRITDGWDWEKWFSESIASINWASMWDGLADAFWSVMQFIAGVWNKTVGGMSVDLPGMEAINIPEINIGDRPTGRDMAGTPGGMKNPPKQPTPGDRGGRDEDTGFGAVSERVVIQNTFNERVDPDHLSRSLAWDLAGVAV